MYGLYDSGATVAKLRTKNLGQTHRQSAYKLRVGRLQKGCQNYCTRLFVILVFVLTSYCQMISLDIHWSNNFLFTWSMFIGQLETAKICL